MRRFLSFASLIALCMPGCAASDISVEPQPIGYSQRMAAAARHDQASDARERHIAAAVHAGPVGNGCSDTVLNDQLTTGGERVTDYTPCWDYEDASARDQVSLKDVAPTQPVVAAADQQAVKGLVETEIAACAHIPERERERSPFEHRRAIAEVQPAYEGGQLRGVRVVFKPVPALTAEWMRKDIACHQAHVAALHAIPDTMLQDPTLVQNAEVTVSDDDGRVAVTVRTDSPDQAALALAKARHQGPTGSVAMGPTE